jgi:hypothetical protein
VVRGPSPFLTLGRAKLFLATPGRAPQVFSAKDSGTGFAVALSVHAGEVGSEQQDLARVPASSKQRARTNTACSGRTLRQKIAIPDVPTVGAVQRLLSSVLSV